MSQKMVALGSLGPAFAFLSNCDRVFSRFDRIHERDRHLSWPRYDSIGRACPRVARQKAREQLDDLQ